MLSLWRECPVDLLIAIEIGVSRALAAPAITQIFVEHQGYFNRGSARQTSAMRAVALLIQHGLSHPISRQAMIQVDEIHRLHNVPPEHLLYALACVVYGMESWFSRNSPRPLSDRDLQDVCRFWHDVAIGCRIADPPRDFDGWNRWRLQFEAEQHAPSRTNQVMAIVMARIFANRFPRGCRFLARKLFIAMLPYDLHHHIGYGVPATPMRWMTSACCQLRKLLVKIVPAARRLGTFLYSDALQLPAPSDEG
ncbi:hypothetical protein LOC68_17900 [Blastopirellula sp. JC732]|uniref:ER-bound oxygenase mpaB/mpaB'/Rubber oxygenase catalytic domain-containing protein n=1 Tax=Blastopirellula sediminis TaxID=2894196 RepID=A0A9X1MPV8_9BACT|nr:hypothetical protein [Blastopirellula sediminis]MCC9606430.1 hypothetical protein [Blastopirellula sediminis]MCC9630272.1 hypothetical protein [Blastopirellula sediminis]